jgi:dihydroorotase
VSEEKDVEFDAAAFGVAGLETSLGVVLTYLADKDLLKPADVVLKMSCNPNKILGVPGGTLSVGTAADITIIDPKAAWKVESQHFFSKARNTAFEGFPLKGYACCTILDGRVVFERTN